MMNIDTKQNVTLTAEIKLLDAESVLTPEAEWEHLWSLASKAAKSDGATQRDVHEEFSRLLKKRNPLAVQAQKQLIESEKDNSYRKRAPGFSEGTLLFRPFSTELPFLRG